MKLQKIILCVAIALTAFGASLGLLEIGNYLCASFQPLKVEIPRIEPFATPVYAPARRPPELKQPVFTPTEESKPAEESGNPDKTGYYNIIGANPKGFGDFNWLELITAKYDQKIGKVLAVKAEGSIDTRKGFFRLSRISLNGNRISLVSEKINGVSYQFEGKFDEEIITYKKDGVEYEQTIALKGRLTNWRKGVKIAEANVKFAFSVGC